MWEALTAAGVAACILAFGALNLLLQPLARLWLGVGLLALGALGSVVAGGVYHLRLYRALAPRGLLPSRWYLSPQSLHRRFPAPKGAVLGWFYAGAAAFVLVLVGALIVLGSVASL